nr:unnamed protein product [Callosobruchus chinensis]
MNNQALPRSHSFKLLGVSVTENMIWHEHVSSIATATGNKLGYLFRARKYFSPSNLLTLCKAQIRPSLEYCSHICLGVKIICAIAVDVGIRIVPKIEYDYRKIVRLLKEENIRHHTCPLSSERKIHAVIRGISVSATKQQIKEELKQKGYAPHHIIRETVACSCLW